MEEFRQSAQSRLRNLPFEIRLKIYEHMTPPIDSRLVDWRGLFLSCKEIHYEMKHELLRNMIKYLNRIQKDWMKAHNVPLQICAPTSITSIQRLSVAIPNSYFRGREAQFPATRIFSATLLSLLQLSISQLSIRRYENDEKMKRTTAPVTEHSLADFVRDLLDLMDPSKPAGAIKCDNGTELVVSRGSAVEKIAFEWGTFDGALGDDDLVLPYYASDCPDDRTTEFVRGHICAPATGVVWKRRRYTWYGHVLGDIWHESRSLPE